MKPVKIVVPYAPGGATDIVTRIVAEQMRQSLGQSFVVENKPGAFGIVAIQEMMNARPDGYTLMIGNVSTNAITPVIVPERLKINYSRDVAPVTNLIDIPAFLVVTTTNFAREGRQGADRLRQEESRQDCATAPSAPAAIRITTWRSSPSAPATSTWSRSTTSGRLRHHQRHDDRRRAGRVPQRRVDRGADQGRQAAADRGGQSRRGCRTIRTCRP